MGPHSTTLSLIFLTALCLLCSSTDLPKDKVKEHYMRVEKDISCSTPQPRVILVESLEVKAVPPATILHRCGSSTGCCPNQSEECVARRKERVPLYFLMGPHSVGGSSGEQNVVVKFMTNHTECHCRERSTRRTRRMERRVKRRNERTKRRREGKRW